jgi:hypothetical protein
MGYEVHTIMIPKNAHNLIEISWHRYCAYLNNARIMNHIKGYEMTVV